MLFCCLLIGQWSFHLSLHFCKECPCHDTNVVNDVGDLESCPKTDIWDSPNTGDMTNDCVIFPA
jgi:hypothetical protein